MADERNNFPSSHWLHNISQSLPVVWWLALFSIHSLVHVNVVHKTEQPFAIHHLTNPRPGPVRQLRNGGR